MDFDKLSGIAEQPAKADKSAVCAINSAPTGIRVSSSMWIIGGNRHQSKARARDSVGARAVGWRMGGPLWSPGGGV